jgi:hypothetical protein
MIDDNQEKVPGTVIELCEEGACVSKIWLVKWKTGINLRMLY